LYHVKRIIIESNKSFRPPSQNRPQEDQVSLKQGNSTSLEAYILEQLDFIWNTLSSSSICSKLVAVKGVKLLEDKESSWKKEIEFLGYLSLTHAKLLS